MNKKENLTLEKLGKQIEEYHKQDSQALRLWPITVGVSFLGSAFALLVSNVSPIWGAMLFVIVAAYLIACGVWGRKYRLPALRG